MLFARGNDATKTKADKKKNLSTTRDGKQLRRETNTTQRATLTFRWLAFNFFFCYCYCTIYYFYELDQPERVVHLLESTAVTQYYAWTHNSTSNTFEKINTNKAALLLTKNQIPRPGMHSSQQVVACTYTQTLSYLYSLTLSFSPLSCVMYLCLSAVCPPIPFFPMWHKALQQSCQLVVL